MMAGGCATDPLALRQRQDVLCWAWVQWWIDQRLSLSPLRSRPMVDDLLVEVMVNDDQPMLDRNYAGNSDGDNENTNDHK